MINDVNAATYYNWTVKTWLIVEMPESYSSHEMSAEMATLNKINTTAYNLNANGESIIVAPQADDTFAYICQSSKLGENNFSLTMNYDYANVTTDYINVNPAKSVSVNLVAPKAVRIVNEEVRFETIANAGVTEGEALIVDEANKEYVVENTTYNSMTAMFSFAKPNVEVNISDAYDVVYLPVVGPKMIGKYVDSNLGSNDARTIKFKDVNVLSDNISFAVETRYYPKGSVYGEDGYILGTIGEGVNVVSELPKLEYVSAEILPSVATTIEVDQNQDSSYNIHVKDTSVSFEQSPIIAGVELNNIYFDFDVLDMSFDEITGLQLGSEIYSFGKVAEVPEVIAPVRVSATPIYIFSSEMNVAETTGIIVAETVMPESETEYFALRGVTGYKDVEGGEIVGVESAIAEGVSINVGVNYIEVLGTTQNQVYDISGILVGTNSTRYEVTSGIYFIKVGNKVAKVFVK